MYQPLVSIIIPVYNGSNYLSQAIDSALAQTYKNTEIIVINDGSIDDGATEKIALGYGNKIRYFYKENGGVSSALNLGIKNMKGEWFSWLSHDDLYLPDKIKSEIEKVILYDLDTETSIISCKTGLISASGKTIFRPKRFHSGFYNGKEMFRNLFNGKELSGCALLIPKKALEEVGSFQIEYKYIQDWICWVLMGLRGYNFYLYNDELVKSRVHKNQATNKISNLYPLETSKFLNILIENYLDNIKGRDYFIKTVLYYECTKLSDKKLRERYLSKLKELNEFSFIEKLKYLVFLLRGQTIRLIKIIYRSFIKRKYRGK